MIELVYVEIEGFTLFKDLQRVDFSKFEPNSIIGVFGKNNDGEGGYDSNGSGKSNFLNSIDWCWFDRIPVQSNKETAISKSDVVNKDSKKARVKVGLKTAEHFIETQNSRTQSGTKKFELWIDGVEFIANTDTQRRNKFFSLLGIGGKGKMYYSDFLNNCHFTGEIEKSFASTNFSDQKRLEIVSRLRKLEIWDISYDLTKSDKDRTREFLKESKIKLTALLEMGYDEKLTKAWRDREIKAITKVIVDLKIKYNNIIEYLDKSRQYQVIQGQYSKYQSDKLLIEKEIDNNISTIRKVFEDWKGLIGEKDEYDKKILEIKESKDQLESLEYYQETKKQYEDQKTQLVEHKANISNDIRSTKTHIKELEDKKYHSCPKCSTELLFENSKLKVANAEESKKLIIKYKESLATLEDDLEKTEKVEIDRKVLIQQTEELIDKVKELSRSLVTYSSTLNRINIKLKNPDFDDLQSYLLDGELHENVLTYENYTEWIEINDLMLSKKKEVDSLKEELGEIIYEESDLSEAQKQISEGEEKIRNIEKKYSDNEEILKKIETEQALIDEYQAEIDVYDKWLLYFKQLKTIELLETKPLLELATNNILSTIGTNIRVEYLLNVDENSLSLQLEEGVDRQIPLEMFSTGQSTRISFAAGLALRHLSDESSMDFGFSIWDEVLDGLDHTGQSLFFDVLHKLEGIKLCISHDANLQNYFTNKILITRENNQSTIKII